MFRALYGELTYRVVVYHEGNGVKRLTELTQYVLSVAAHDLHVHETTGTPARNPNDTLMLAVTHMNVQTCQDGVNVFGAR